MLKHPRASIERIEHSEAMKPKSGKKKRKCDQVQYDIVMRQADAELEQVQA